MSDPVDMTFVTLDVEGGTWLEWGSSISGVTDMVDQAIAKLGPGQCIRRLILCTHGSTGGAFLGFDATGAGVEVIDGAQMDAHVKAELQRLRPYFCPDGVIEIRCCQFATGAKGKLAVQGVADTAGVPVTAPEDSISSVMGVGGICATWATAYPSSMGIPVTTSWWRGSGVEQTPAGAAGQAGAAAAAALAEPRFVPMPGLPSPSPPGPAEVSPEVRRALLFNNKPSPEAGYQALNSLGALMEHPPEPDTPPPFQYIPPLQPLPPTGGHPGSSPPAEQLVPPVEATTPGPAGNPVYTKPRFTPLPGLGITLSEGATEPSVGSSLGGPVTGWSVWQLGPLNLWSGPGFGCSALGCLLVLLSVLAATTFFEFHLGPFAQSPASAVASEQPTASATVPPGQCSGAIVTISDQFYPDVVLGGGGTPPTFSTNGKHYCLVHLATYHWNGGAGDPPSATDTLAVRDASGRELGKWSVFGTPGTGGTLSGWEANVPYQTNPVVIDGTYTVVDSKVATWSQSKASGGKGFARVYGIPYVTQ